MFLSFCLLPSKKDFRSLAAWVKTQRLEKLVEFVALGDDVGHKLLALVEKKSDEKIMVSCSCYYYSYWICDDYVKIK
jgi:aspartyl/asparaginyl-tRNA synthetase